MRTGIIFSASSDICAALCDRWLSHQWKLYGTYRTRSKVIDRFERSDMKLFKCDFTDPESIRLACASIASQCGGWDVLVLGSGMLEPVSLFSEADFAEWESSLGVNFISQLRIVHHLLPYRKTDARLLPCVLFFAGSGTNSAPLYYSAYTVSKIALIKMAELLDAEIPDTQFFIVGPGWIRTKIHQATMEAGPKAGENYQRTIQKLANDDFTPMEEVLEFCDWLLNQPKEIVSGRNFSVVGDKIDSSRMETLLSNNPDMFKLRRFGNDWVP